MLYLCIAIQKSELTQSLKGKEADLNYEKFLYMENQMMYPYYPYDGRHQGRGMAATGIGLAAGLGGAALIGVLLTAWGVNKASEARSSANQNALNNVSALLLQERNSRETFQNLQVPTIRNYVDVQAGAGAGAYANALAYAQANGINSAIGHDSFLKVQRYSAPVPCGCDTCNG